MFIFSCDSIFWLMLPVNAWLHVVLWNCFSSWLEDNLDDPTLQKRIVIVFIGTPRAPRRDGSPWTLRTAWPSGT